MDEASGAARAERSRAVVVLRGDIDVVTVPDVRERALALLATPVERVQVDMSGCTFLDSAGIALLGGLWSRARELDAEFVLTDPPTNVRVVLTIAGLAGLIDDGRGGQS
jgi:anti-anti-sigma factor